MAVTTKKMRIKTLLTALLAGIPGILQAGIIHVKPDADALNTATGASWAQATNLQRALSLSSSGDEIWVESGMYFPDEGQGQTDNDLSATFTLRESVNLYGGFSGNEAQLVDRDLVNSPRSVLSGDIDKNDINTDGNNIAESHADIQGSNSLNIITASSLLAARIDGFAITAGNSTSFSPSNAGGLFVQTANITIANCRFSGNNGGYGGAISLEDSEPMILNCTFTGNNSDDGGAIGCTDSTPVVMRTAFEKNTEGGAIHCYLSNAVFVDCEFSENHSNGSGGVGEISYSSPSFVNCRFEHNQADHSGGAFFNDRSNPVYTNCLFLGNKALGEDDMGGAIFNRAGVSVVDPDMIPVFSNCTFTKNSAFIGGAIHNLGVGCKPVLSNCILWGNFSRSGTDTITVNNNSPAIPTFENCIIEGSGAGANWRSALGIDGGGNLDSNPYLIPGGYALQATSPAIDAGNSSKVPTDIFDLDDDNNIAESTPFDIDNRSRIVGASVDIGCSEFSGGAIASPIAPARLDPSATPLISYLDLSEVFDTSAVQFHLVSIEPAEGFVATADASTGIVDLSISPGYLGPVFAVFSATDSEENVTYVSANFTIAPEILYVNDTATGADNGSSWQDAFMSLQDALGIGGFGYEIWVASGIHYPDTGAGLTDGDRTASFRLPSHIKIYGGFNGTESTLTQRVMQTPSILSGDIDQDDTSMIAETTTDVIGGNSYHLVTSSGTSIEARLDGFTITAGLADDPFDYSEGGGMRNLGGALTVANCVFSGNYAIYGGAVFNQAQPSANFSKCTFQGNKSSTHGDAVYIKYSNPVIEECDFVENSRGAVYAYYGTELSIYKSQFLRNSQLNGQSAVTSISSLSTTIMNCRFIENTSNTGGAVSISGVSLIANCLFWRNTAIIRGGAIAVGEANVVNCTIVENDAREEGGGIHSFGEDDLHFKNCIIWGNTANESSQSISASVSVFFPHFSPFPIFSNCILANSGGSASWETDAGVDSGGNLDSDPLLGSDPLVLPAASPAIDAGVASLLPLDTLDIDGDGDQTESLPLDLLENPRALFTSVDIGAAEFQGGPRATDPGLITFQPNSSAQTLQLSDIFDSSATVFSIVEISPSAPITAKIDSSGNGLVLTPLSNTIGVAMVTVSAGDALGRTSVLTINVRVFQVVIYVNDDATGAASGLSWEDAFLFLSDALAVAQDGMKIWIASGVYYPDDGDDHVEGDRDASFVIPIGVSIYGGFAGNELLFSERTLQNASPTVLSGDIDHNDENADGNLVTESSDQLVGLNTLDLVIALDSLPSDTIDGVTVTASMSGGLIIVNGPRTVLNCQFVGNRGFASNRAPVYLAEESVVSFTDCFFSGNKNDAHGGALKVDNSTVTLSNCDFSENDSDSGDRGGAIYAITSDLNVKFCDFSNNVSYEGGAVFVGSDTTAAFEDCDFSGNLASSRAGAVQIDSATVTMARCNFEFNESTGFGGAVYSGSSDNEFSHCIFLDNGSDYGGAYDSNWDDLKMINCLFSGNTASDRGGAISATNSDIDIINSTLSDNSSDQYGGAVFNWNSTLIFQNSILWANTAVTSNPAFSKTIHNWGDPTASFQNCIVEGSGGSAWISTLGINAGNNLDAAPQFASGSYQLLSTSPALNAGSNAAIPSDLLDVDDDGNTSETIPVDIYGNPRLQNSIVDIGAAELFIGPAAPPIPPVRIAPNSPPLSNAVNVSSGFPLGSSGFALVSILPTEILNATVNPTTGQVGITVQPNAIGNVAIQVSAIDPQSIVQSATFFITVAPPVFFVDANGSGSDTGLTWEEAFPTLQDALKVDGYGYEIWVASGVYFPDEGGDQINNNRNATFQLKNGIPIYGGFTGDETSVAQRIRTAAPSILSGDIDKNDQNADGNSIAEQVTDIIGNNAYHIITGTGAPMSSILDGFVITGGRANGSSRASDGAALLIEQGDPTFKNCVFIGNSASDDGGVGYITASYSQFTNCSFLNNRTTADGGVFHHYLCHTNFVNCIFGNNTANDDGGALYNFSSNPSFTNCTLVGNAAGDLGGALYNTNSDPILTSRPVLLNSILWANTSRGADSLAGTVSNRTDCYATFANSIVSHSGAPFWLFAAGVNAGGNMDTDPLFMSSTDYHLQVNSPAIDAGGNLFNPETTDNKGIPRFLDGDSDNNTLIDIGAYEYFSPLEDLDGDGFHNAIEYLATATITDLIFPTIDAGIILSAGSNYPSLAYKYDSRLTPHLDFIIEKSSDLGMNDPWADITMLPVLATEEKGMTRILVRETSPVLPGGKDYYRLRMEPK